MSKDLKERKEQLCSYGVKDAPGRDKNGPDALEPLRVPRRLDWQEPREAQEVHLGRRRADPPAGPCG